MEHILKIKISRIRQGKGVAKNNEEWIPYKQHEWVHLPQIKEEIWQVKLETEKGERAASL